MENAIAVQQSLQVDDTQSKLAQLEGCMMQVENNLKSGVEGRIHFLEEKRMTDIADQKASFEFFKERVERRLSGIDAQQDVVGAALQRCDSIDRRVVDLEGRQGKDVETARHQLSTVVDMQRALGARVDQVDQKLGDGNAETCRKLANLDAGYAKLKHMYDEVNIASGDTSSRDERYEDVEKRLAHLQVALDNVVAAHSPDLESAQTKLRDMHGRIEQQRIAQEKHRSSIEQRCSLIEGRILDGACGIELMQEMDKRITYMQEDQKRQRETMESSIFEQLRQEHAALYSQANQIKEQWDREMKARQAYMDSYKELLAKERNAREMNEIAMGCRVEACERHLGTRDQLVGGSCNIPPAGVGGSCNIPPAGGTGALAQGFTALDPSHAQPEQHGGSPPLQVRAANGTSAQGGRSAEPTHVQSERAAAATTPMKTSVVTGTTPPQRLSPAAQPTPRTAAAAYAKLQRGQALMMRAQLKAHPSSARFSGASTTPYPSSQASTVSSKPSTVSSKARPTPPADLRQL
jgi:hypothetical protein